MALPTARQGPIGDMRSTRSFAVIWGSGTGTLVDCPTDGAAWRNHRIDPMLQHEDAIRDAQWRFRRCRPR
jgi:hypothetical protein